MADITEKNQHRAQAIPSLRRKPVGLSWDWVLEFSLMWMNPGRGLGLSVVWAEAGWAEKNSLGPPIESTTAGVHRERGTTQPGHSRHLH